MAMVMAKPSFMSIAPPPLSPASLGVAAPERTPTGAPTPHRSRRWHAHGILLVVHRYVGLTIATFLVVAGLTGSVLAFNHELDALINPKLFQTTPPTAKTLPLPPLELRERAEASLGSPLRDMPLAFQPGHAHHVWAQVADGRWREIFIDPYTGAVQGQRTWGDLSEGMTNLMPFIYRLHYQLALGTVGFWLMGIIALLWTLDCFIGFYLTLPARRSGSGMRPSFWERWKPSWLVKGSSLFGGIFTFHRASGLWVWPLLFVFAWSAVGFNMPSVFRPVMGTLGSETRPWDDMPSQDPPREQPALDWAAALATGERLMAAEAAARGFTVTRAEALAYAPHSGLYEYRVYSSLDLAERWPATRIWFDGDSGDLHRFHAPTGLAAGDTISSWLFALHMGTVGGLAYRIVVCVMGVVVTTLAITGVWIWWGKRRLRCKAKTKARATVQTHRPTDSTSGVTG